MFENDLEVFESGKTLLIDGDILLYKPCCVFNDDSDSDRHQITKICFRQVQDMLVEAGCDDYIMFVTTKTNFRNDLVDDYKLKRDDDETPVNLAFAKKWAVSKLDAVYKKGLEADDLLGIHMADNCVLWSPDKDLRQVPGLHLDEETRKIVEITEKGTLLDLGKKIKFEGMTGFYYQLLVGDSTDHIVGCGKRVEKVYKSGKKKGETYIARQGIGPKAAFKLLAAADVKGGLEHQLQVVIQEYKAIHGDDWQEHIETQANLLWMVRYMDGEVIQRWTHDGREEYFDLVKGVIIHDYTKPGQAAD